MEKIKEVIVVEGKNDALKLKQVFECDVFLTYGYSITNRKLDLLKNLALKRGLIYFLDPDVVGEKIRKKLNEKIPNQKNAYIDKKDAKTHCKVGIEHAKNEDIYNAIKNLITFCDKQETISMSFLDQFNLRNNAEGTKNREKLCRKLHLGHCNFKALHKRLNLIEISEEEIIKIMEGE